MEKILYTWIILILISTTVSASELMSSLLVNLKEQGQLVDLIAYCVIIILMILIIFHLHSIDEHLNWIRRIK